MHKSLLAVGILSFSMTFAEAAQAAQAGDGFFVQASVGEADVSGIHVDDRAGFGQLAGGYRWSSGFGVELGYMGTGDFGQSIDVLLPGSSQNVRSSTDVSFDGWMLGGNWRHRIGERGYFLARGGLFDWGLDADSQVCNPTCMRASGEADGTDYYVGIGGGYDLTENLSLGLSYDYFRADMPVLPPDAPDIEAGVGGFSLSAQWRF